MRIGQRHADTNTGRKRRHNEDAYVCDPPLFAVADGMGGAQAGEIASSLAAAALRERTDSGASGEERVVELIREANRRVHQRAIDDSAASGMGTTMTVALVEPVGRVTIGHVGDSRAYVLREDELEQLTDDHSLVAELVRRGELSPEEAEVHPQRSVITRALGTDPEVEVDAFGIEAREGDLFLLCSDGLTTMVDQEEIARLLARNRGDLASATRALIRAANDRGGDDNITVVLFELAAGDETAETAIVAGAQERDPGEEDTLHPGEVAALETRAGAVPAGDAAGDTAVVPAARIQSALAAAGVDDAGPAEPTLARKALATLVILALVALIAFLVVRGLAR